MEKGRLQEEMKRGMEVCDVYLATPHNECKYDALQTCINENLFTKKKGWLLVNHVLLTACLLCLLHFIKL